MLQYGKTLGRSTMALVSADLQDAQNMFFSIFDPQAGSSVCEIKIGIFKE